MKIKSILSPMVSLALLTPALGFSATPAGTMPAAQQQQIEGVVHDYILKNPQVVVQSLQVYQQQQMDQTQELFKKIQATAPQFADQLLRNPGDPVIGNTEGTVTIVEFFDYQCPHCVDMAPTMANIVKNNNNLRVVLKPFPIRGPVSEFATKAVFAAQNQGKFQAMHDGLMNSKTQPLTNELILDIAKAQGLDLNQLQRDMSSAAVANKIKANMDLAKSMQLMWTPVFFVAKTATTTKAGPNAIVFVPGQVPEAQLVSVIGQVG